MNIEIKLKTEKKVTVDFLEFGYFGSDDTILTVDWDESQYEPGDIYGKGVQINEEYANGRINELIGLELTALQVYDLESEQEMDWIEVESISFSMMVKLMRLCRIIYNDSRGMIFRQIV